MKVVKLLPALLLCLILPLSAFAAQQLTADRSRQYDARAGVGSFDLVIYVDGEALVNVQDTSIRYILLSGSPLQNAGSNYTQPIPRAVFGSFTLEKIAGRGTVTMAEQPNPKNNFTAVVRIKDEKAGRELYHVRLTWTWNPADPSRSPYTGIADRGGRPEDRGGARNNDRDADERDSRNRDNDERGDGRVSRAGLFEFKGRVDGVTVLRIHADQVRVENVSGLPLRSQSFKFTEPLPTTQFRDFELENVVGRGKVELVEKPWEGNRYTAVVRISDNSPGNGDYSFSLAWHR